ncbi:MAG: helix-turn-helix transcriptional regulator [Mogibacterium sp.]|nr:helix-turn-helix transcriptional regulator [Mogibacterium sp.]MBQ6501920.1 helix-turn-helix transcriptional regulator [Mogibacterium sp.]
MEVGKRIAKIRKDNNLSQEKFAEKYYVTQQTVSHWENGKSFPDLATLVKISDDFNVSLDELLKGDKDMVSSIMRSVKLGKYYKYALIAVIGIAVTVAAVFGVRYLEYRNVSREAMAKYEAGLEKYGFDRFGNGWDLDYVTYINGIQYVADEPSLRNFDEGTWGIVNQGVFAVIDPESRLGISTGSGGREIDYHVVLRLFHDMIDISVYEDQPDNKEMYYHSFAGLVGTYSGDRDEGVEESEMSSVVRQVYRENKDVIDSAFAQALEMQDTLY